MALRKLLLPPDEPGYSLADPATAVGVAYDGPQTHFRAGPLGEPVSLSASWTLDGEEYVYLRAFYLLTGAKGLPFLVDLMVDSGDLVECTARFVAGTFALAEQSGETYRVTAELRVAPPLLTDAAAQAIVEAFMG